MKSRRVTPPSDVTGRKKSVTNLGRTAAAGVVPGARLWSASCFKLRSLGVWPEKEPVRSSRERGRVLGEVVARQSRARSCADGWCRAQDDDERADEFETHLSSRTDTSGGRAKRIPPRVGPWEGCVSGYLSAPRERSPQMAAKW